MQVMIFLIGVFIGVVFGVLLDNAIVSHTSSGFFVVDLTNNDKTRVQLDLHRELPDIMKGKTVRFRVLKKD